MKKAGTIFSLAYALLIVTFAKLILAFFTRLSPPLWCDMIRKERLRRVAILCCHCLRNLAYYRAGWHGDELILKGQFWINVNGNLLDICVLEWCKLFGDLRGKHYWGKIISDTQTFYAGMLHKLKVVEAELESLKKEMRRYRDKFVAHLDSDKTMYLPSNLTLAQKSVEYLYDYIIANEDEGDFFNDAPSNAKAFFEQHLRYGKAEYEKLKVPTVTTP